MATQMDLSHNVFEIPLSKLVQYLDARDLCHLESSCRTIQYVVECEWERRENNSHWRRDAYVGGLIGAFKTDGEGEEGESMMTIKEREIQFAKAAKFTASMEEQAYWHGSAEGYHGCQKCEDFPKLCEKANLEECFVRLCRWKRNEEGEETGKICWQGFFKGFRGAGPDGHTAIPERASQAIISGLPELPLIVNQFLEERADNDSDDVLYFECDHFEPHTTTLQEDYIALTIATFNRRSKQLELVVASHLPHGFSLHVEHDNTISWYFESCYEDPHGLGETSKFYCEPLIVVAPTSQLSNGNLDANNNNDNNTIEVKTFRFWQIWNSGYFSPYTRREIEEFEIDALEDDFMAARSTPVRRSRRRTPRRYPRKCRRTRYVPRKK